MKISTFPACAAAFAFLSVARVVLTHYNLITLSPAWLLLTSYSAVIAAAAWLDRRSAQSVEAPHPLDSNDTAAALAVQGYDLTNVVAFAPRKSGNVRQEQQPRRQAA